MAAAFPQSIKSFSNKVDLVNTVLADHVNALQDEVRAISIAITGNPSTNILTSSYSGVFANTTTWTSVDERLNNIEAGLVGGVADSPYFKKSGDSVQPASGVVGLTIKPLGGSTNIFETYTAGNVLGFNLNVSGIPKVGTANVLYVGSSDHTSLSNTATSALNTAEAIRFDPFLLAGM